MRGNRQKLWFAVCGTSLGLLLAIAGAGAQSTAPKAPVAPAGPKLAEEEFKNIQALKGIPADQVIPSMQFIAASLGVECEYCHVAHANEKDDKKPKVTARKMINMMMAINKDNFEGHREVTCYSCHRGSADPVGTPIIVDEEPKPAAVEGKKLGEEKASMPVADQLLDKYLSAIGGAAAIQKITSRVQKGTLSAFGGEHFPVELYFPARVKTLYQKFTVDSGGKIDGHDTYLVTGHTEGQPPLRLYLDRESGLLLRLVRYAETPLGRNPTQIDYADYRDANGVKVPFRWTLARPGNRFTIQVEQVQQNVPVDDAKFAPPLPSAGPKAIAP